MVHMMRRMIKQEQNLTRYQKICCTRIGLADLFLDPAWADLWTLLVAGGFQRLAFDQLTKHTMSMSEQIMIQARIKIRAVEPDFKKSNKKSEA